MHTNVTGVATVALCVGRSAAFHGGSASPTGVVVNMESTLALNGRCPRDIFLSLNPATLQSNAMRFLYIATHGSENPTKATLPFVMAKGAHDAGHEVEIVLMGDAVVLFNDTVAGNVQGVGVASLEEVRGFARDKHIPVFG